MQRHVYSKQQETRYNTKTNTIRSSQASISQQLTLNLFFVCRKLRIQMIEGLSKKVKHTKSPIFSLVSLELCISFSPMFIVHYQNFLGTFVSIKSSNIILHHLSQGGNCYPHSYINHILILLLYGKAFSIGQINHPLIANFLFLKYLKSQNTNIPM